MSKLVPLLREGATELESLLLEAARDDAPPDSAARARTLAALRAASGTAVVGAGLAGWHARWFAKLGAAKWLAVFCAGTALTGAALTWSDAASTSGPSSIDEASTAPPRAIASAPSARAAPSAVPSARPTTPSVASRATARGITASPPRAEDHAIASSRSEPARSASTRSEATQPATSASPPRALAPSGISATESARRAEGLSPESVHASESPTAAGTASAASSPPPAASLREEAARLEAVRAALAASAPSRAFAALDAYDAQFGRAGILAQEAAVLRVQALLASGDRAAAARAAEAFERAYPASSYAPRVRAMVEKNP